MTLRPYNLITQQVERKRNLNNKPYSFFLPPLFRLRFSYSSSLRAHTRQDLPPLLSCRNADRECT